MASLAALLPDTCSWHVAEFSAQHCANVAWSFAHLAFVEAPLFASIAVKFEKLISEAKSQELFNIV